jgi:hypothetical protein
MLIAPQPKRGVGRLIQHAKARYPEKTDAEIYEIVITNFGRDHH